MSTKPSGARLAQIARRIRADVVRVSHRGRVPHLGSALSCVDILTALYWGVLRVDPRRPHERDRDRCILSKGHAGTALYAALAHRGFFPAPWLKRVGEEGGRLPEHPCPRCLPGVEFATGSLGHGLPAGLGLALASRIRRRPYRVFVVLSDGECNEGTVWEAAMLAAAQRVGNLVAVVDFNKWQATGRSTEVMALQPLRRKWEAFGWRAVEADGHDAGALAALLRRLPKAGAPPAVVVAHTVKGRGVSFMEDDNNWHYKTPNDEELAAALKELGAGEAWAR